MQEHRRSVHRGGQSRELAVGGKRERSAPVVSVVLVAVLLLVVVELVSCPREINTSHDAAAKSHRTYGAYFPRPTTTITSYTLHAFPRRIWGFSMPGKPPSGPSEGPDAYPR